LKARFIAPASLEPDEAVTYYEHQLPGLGYRFFRETSISIERILFMPDAWPKVGERTRRCMLKGFSYALFYVQEQQEILVTAVAHLHRDPEHYRNRIE